MDEKLIEAARKAFSTTAPSIRLGAPVSGGAAYPEPLVCLPISMMNRHGVIAGATGTGKTRTLQLVAEQLSASGVPVFLADMKGDLSGLGVAGKTGERVEKRAQETGYSWRSSEFPIEFLSLTGAKGAHLRATVSSFGPLLLAKVLDLNETQTGALTLVFKYCDDRKLPLLDLADLRTVLQYLTGDGAGELKDFGGIAKATAGVLLRKMVELEHQGALAFFGEPEFDLDDLFVVDGQGRGMISALDRESAREILEARLAPAGAGGEPAAGGEKRGAERKGKGPLEDVLRSPLTRTVTREVARGLLGALLGTPPRRRRTIP
ncbi:MAG: DUF853 family protein [Candidatus Eisenbacteria bacterium]|nr:DUF853 family protein [Candidatus Eisenbacteria bacterium]